MKNLKVMMMTLMMCLMTIVSFGQTSDDSVYVEMEPTSYADNVEALKLFPNPATDIAYIISANGQKISEVKLIDMTGKTVWTKAYLQADFQATVETSSLHNGVYQLMVRVNGNWIAKKLVISNPRLKSKKRYGFFTIE